MLINLKMTNSYGYGDSSSNVLLNEEKKAKLKKNNPNVRS